MAKQSTAVMILDRLPESRLPVAPAMLERMGLTEEEWQVLCDQTFPNARTAAAVHMALNYCRVRQLDIYRRPVHIVPMWSSVLGRMVETIWPGINELRTTASRTGEYAGISATDFGPTVDGEFVHKWEDEQRREQTTKYQVQFPEWCALKVFRLVHGEPREFHARVYWREAYASINRFSQAPNEMWRKRPFGQVEKCTEAAALRRAFPSEIGNEMTSEEMAGKVIDHDNEEQVSRMVTEAGEAGGEQKAVRRSRPVAPKPPEVKAKEEPKGAETKQKPAGEPADRTEGDNWSLSEADAEYLENLRDRLGEAKTKEDAEAIYKELDPPGFFHDDEDSQKVCQSILDFRLKVIARNKE